MAKLSFRNILREDNVIQPFIYLFEGKRGNYSPVTLKKKKYYRTKKKKKKKLTIFNTSMSLGAIITLLPPLHHKHNHANLTSSFDIEYEKALIGPYRLQLSQRHKPKIWVTHMALIKFYDTTESKKKCIQAHVPHLWLGNFPCYC